MNAIPAVRPNAPRTTWDVYTLIAVLWLATRVLAINSIDMTPWMLNDIDIYQSWLPGLTSLTFPTDDPTWQYPPGAGAVFLVGSWLPFDFRWAFTLVILAVDAAILAALMLAHSRRPGSALRGVWLWAGAGLIVGSIMFVRFDLVPTLFAVLVVLLAGRPALAGVSAALGFLVKLWPALMLLSLPRRGAKRGIVAFVISTGVLLLAFVATSHDSLSFIGNQRARGLQVESTGALPYMVYSLFDPNVVFGLQYGSIQVLMSGAEIVGTGLTVVGLAVIALIAWWRFSRRLDTVPPGDVALTVMLVSVATSRVYSPQFNVWLIGLAAAAMIARETRLRVVAAILIAVSILTQVVYPWSATQLVTGSFLIVGVQSLVIAGLLTATVLSLIAIRRSPLTTTGP